MEKIVKLVKVRKTHLKEWCDFYKVNHNKFIRQYYKLDLKKYSFFIKQKQKVPARIEGKEISNTMVMTAEHYQKFGMLGFSSKILVFKDGYKLFIIDRDWDAHKRFAIKLRG